MLSISLSCSLSLSFLGLIKFLVEIKLKYINCCTIVSKIRISAFNCSVSPKFSLFTGTGSVYIIPSSLLPNTSNPSNLSDHHVVILRCDGGDSVFLPPTCFLLFLDCFPFLLFCLFLYLVFSECLLSSITSFFTISFSYFMSHSIYIYSIV